MTRSKRDTIRPHAVDRAIEMGCPSPFAMLRYVQRVARGTHEEDHRGSVTRVCASRIGWDIWSVVWERMVYYPVVWGGNVMTVYDHERVKRTKRSQKRIRKTRSHKKGKRYRNPERAST